MLILGHAGITLAAAVLGNAALTKSGLLPAKRDKPGERSQPATEASRGQTGTRSGRVAWLVSLGKRVDIRVLLVGSLLPDIIDKPVGQLWLRGVLDNGRIFCHTLLFLIFVVSAGVYLYRRWRANWLLVLGAGILAHLVLDQMWLMPRTLFWPVYGFTFDRLEDLTYWWQDMWYALFTEPSVYIPELIGAVILVWFMLVLVTRRRFYSFLVSGQV